MIMRRNGETGKYACFRFMCFTTWRRQIFPPVPERTVFTVRFRWVVFGCLYHKGFERWFQWERALQMHTAYVDDGRATRLRVICNTEPPFLFIADGCLMCHLFKFRCVLPLSTERIKIFRFHRTSACMDYMPLLYPMHQIPSPIHLFFHRFPRASFDGI